MKKTLGLTSVAVAVLLGSYYGMGKVTENTVKETLEMVNLSQSGFTVDVVDYKRGFFSSVADLKWHLVVPEQMVNSNGQQKTIPGQKLDFTMPLTIKHGPVMLSSGIKFGMGFASTDIALPEQMASQFKALFTEDSTQPKLDLSLLVTYLNHAKLNASVPAFMLKDKNGKGNLDWNGMSLSTNMTSDMNKVSGDMSIDGLKFVSDKIVATLEPVSSTFSVHKVLNSLYVGDGSFSLPSFVVKNGDVAMVEVKSLEASSSTDVNDDMFDASISLSLDKVTAQGKTYGPGHLSLSLQQLDAETVSNINQIAQKAKNGSESERQQAMLSIIPQLPKLLSKGATLSLTDTSMTFPEGRVDLSLKTVLPATTESSNPLTLMKDIKGEGSVSMPESLVHTLLVNVTKQRLSADVAAAPADLDKTVEDKVTQQMTGMVNSGFVVKSGDSLSLAFKYENGQLTVNGKPYQPSMLAF